MYYAAADDVAAPPHIMIRRYTAAIVDLAQFPDSGNFFVEDVARIKH